MGIEDFVNLDPGKVRSDKELMRLYVEFHKAAFSFGPQCAGCSFKSGFLKLRKFVKNGRENKLASLQNSTEMKTFELKKEYLLKINSYTEAGKTYRSYGHNMTEDFAVDLVRNGKAHIFKTLPEKIPPAVPVKKTDSKTNKLISEMDWKTEILPMYRSVSENTGRKAKSKKKEDVIRFIVENQD